ncbi:hypothetical protein ARSEF4850_000412 [Beauveria asiatica]
MNGRIQNPPLHSPPTQSLGGNRQVPSDVLRIRHRPLQTQLAQLALTIAGPQVSAAHMEASSPPSSLLVAAKFVFFDPRPRHEDDCDMPIPAGLQEICLWCATAHHCLAQGPRSSGLVGP